MIKPVTMYSVVCDRCGKTFGEDDGIIAWTDICTAREDHSESKPQEKEEKEKKIRQVKRVFSKDWMLFF